MKPTLLLILSLFSCFSVAKAQKNDIIAPPWDKIELTGRYMKPDFVATIEQHKFPWLPVGGGVVVTGGILTYILTKDNPSSTPLLIVKNDIISIACNDNITLDVLINDSGEGLFINSISVVAQADVALTAGNTRLVISNITSLSNFSFNIIIEDKHGQTANSTVTVNVSTPTIIANDDEYEVAFGEPLTANILTNDIGEDLNVTDYTQADGGQVNISNEGVLSFIPNDDFQGITIFTYTLAGICNQTNTASVTITVSPPDCDFDVAFTTSPAHCGEQDGLATINVTPDGAYTYVWDNGGNNAQESLHSGNHTVTITSLDGFCSQELSVFIEEIPAEFNAIFDITSSNCGLNNGAITTTVTPENTYSFNWSNGETSQNISNLAPSQYSVIITNAADCSNEFTTNIDELVDIYLTNITTSPGNCVGSGDIQLTLTTAGTGPVIIDINGPNGASQLSFAAGTHNLSAQMTIPSGDYTLLVYDQNAGIQCAQTVMTTVVDNTTPLAANDDSFSTPFEIALAGNVLDNDSGLQVSLAATQNIMNGVLDVNTDGNFTFFPDPGFSGEASFDYTIVDICGNISTTFVIIVVETPLCDFSVDFDLTAASCGFNDGSATVIVDEPGAYTYQWSNGETTAHIENIGAGDYDVTIAQNSDCSLSFSTIIDENPAMHISDVEVMHPTCSSTGNILFTASSIGDGQLMMAVSHPEGNETFAIESGLVSLAAYVSITGGNYSVIVWDTSANGDCVDSFTATVNDAPILEIVLEMVIPASSPSADDGLIILLVTISGPEPYTVFLDGAVWSVATGTTITLEGVTSGDHSVQILANNGCLSNMLEVFVPFLTFELKVGMTTSLSRFSSFLTDGNREMPSHLVDNYVLREGLSVAATYFLANKAYETRITYFPNQNDQYKEGQLPSYIRVEQLMKLFKIHKKSSQMSLSSGFSTDIFSGVNNLTQTYWQGSIRMNKKLHPYLNIELSASIRGWRTLEKPGFDLGVFMELE